MLIDGGVDAESGASAPAMPSRRRRRHDRHAGFVDTHRHACTSLFRTWARASPTRGVLCELRRPLHVRRHLRRHPDRSAGRRRSRDHDGRGLVGLPADVAAVEAALQAHADRGCARSRARARVSADGEPAPPPPRAIARATSSGLRRRSRSDRSTGGRRSRRVGAEWGRPASSGCGSTRTAAGPIDARRPGGRGAASSATMCARASFRGSTRRSRRHRGLGAWVSLAPSSEMAGGLGAPPIQELIDRDIRPGLGVDDELLAPGDMFAQMRATISVQHATVFDRKLAGKAGAPATDDHPRRDPLRHRRRSPRSRSGRATGSLDPGKQADSSCSAPTGRTSSRSTTRSARSSGAWTPRTSTACSWADAR